MPPPRHRRPSSHRGARAAAVAASALALVAAPSLAQGGGFYWPAERDALLAAATAIVAPEGGQGSVVAGPDGWPDEYDPELGVVPTMTVTYEPNDGSSGLTRKFWARDARGKKWKVKYYTDERITEVAATRLLWRMGYGADHVYPVDTLVCEGCEDDDPWKSMDDASDPPVDGNRVAFRAVSIERSIQKHARKAKKIEVFDGQGVSLDELDALIATLRAGEPERAAELDSLKALAFMLQHSDSKPDNHRLVGIRWKDDRPMIDEKFNQVVVVFQDVGATFGQGRGSVSQVVSKLDYDGWRERMASPWVSPTALQLRLPRGLHAEGGWKDPVISPEGLAFFLERAALVSREDLEAIFRLARFEEASEVPVEQWAEAWELGIANLAHRLPAGGPAN